MIIPVEKIWCIKWMSIGYFASAGHRLSGEVNASNALKRCIAS
jgi:hypothetical protein